MRPNIRWALAATFLLLAAPAYAGEGYSLYANTHYVTAAPGEDVKTVLPLIIPPGMKGIIGWRLSIFAEDDQEKLQWEGNAKLITDGHGVDHCKKDKAEQCDAVMLPSGVWLDTNGASLMFTLRSRETAEPVTARANIWVWFEKAAPVEP